MIIKAIKNAFNMAIDRGWNKIFWAVDIHQTVIIPNYSAAQIPTEFYPKAKEVLQEISKRPDITMIMYTCSHPHEIKQYIDYFNQNEILFSHVNENPEVKNAAYGCYDKKPYFNVLLEDKAGFDPLTDWLAIQKLMRSIPHLSD
ncbi:MAG: hypothetical protein MRY83_05055 [Flavobacteriales bacterium]|nr:hypothetical protein [Flavobacteriales bacterium]